MHTNRHRRHSLLFPFKHIAHAPRVLQNFIAFSVCTDTDVLAARGPSVSRLVKRGASAANRLLLRRFSISAESSRLS